MVVRILGVADLLAALSILLLKFGAVPKTMVFAFAIYVIVKGLIFIKNIPSIVDIVAGILMITAAYYSYFGIPTWLAAVWLTQKGVISLFS